MTAALRIVTSSATVKADVIAAFVARTCAASDVPVRLEDVSAVETISALFATHEGESGHGIA
jgi:hypothetical protein